MTVSTTNRIITAQVSMEIGKAWEPRPGAPPPESARSVPEGTTAINTDVDYECHICGFIGENDDALNNHLNSEHKMVMRANIPQEDGANPDLEGEQELETGWRHSVVIPIQNQAKKAANLAPETLEQSQKLSLQMGRTRKLDWKPNYPNT